MKNKLTQNIENKRLKSILIILGIWWALSIIQGLIQLTLMTQANIFALIGIFLFPIIIYAHIKLYTDLIKKGRVSKTIFTIYISLHFIPIVLQIFGFKQPGFDNIITGIIGLTLIYFRN